MPFDLVVSWFCAVPAAQQALFTRPTKFVQLPTPTKRAYREQVSKWGWPHPLKGMLGQLSINPKDVRRIAVMGFSEGCGGVSGLLRSNDAGYIETVVACDGVHAQWTPVGKPNAERTNIAPGYLDPWIAYARTAAKSAVAVAGLPPGERVCCVTHSSIVPPGYASTTDTADYILHRVFGDAWPCDPVPEGIDDAVYSPPIVLTGNSVNKNAKTTYERAPAQPSIHRNGLYVFGFNNLDPSGVNDHIYQAKVVLPQVIGKIVAARWNAIDPNVSCSGGLVSGPDRIWTGFGEGQLGDERQQCAGRQPVMLPTDYSERHEDASLPCDDCETPISGAETEAGKVGRVVGVAVGLGIIGVAGWLLWRVVSGAGLVPDGLRNPSADKELAVKTAYEIQSNVDDWQQGLIDYQTFFDRQVELWTRADRDGVRTDIRRMFERGPELLGASCIPLARENPGAGKTERRIYSDRIYLVEAPIVDLLTHQVTGTEHLLVTGQQVRNDRYRLRKIIEFTGVGPSDALQIDLGRFPEFRRVVSVEQALEHLRQYPGGKALFLTPEELERQRSAIIVHGNPSPGINVERLSLSMTKRDLGYGTRATEYQPATFSWARKTFKPKELRLRVVAWSPVTHHIYEGLEQILGADCMKDARNYARHLISTGAASMVEIRMEAFAYAHRIGRHEQDWQPLELETYATEETG